MDITRIIAILIPIFIGLFAATQKNKEVEEPRDKKMDSHRSNEELMNEIAKNPNDIRAIYYNGYQLWQSGKSREALAYLLKREDMYRNKDAMYTLIAEIYNDDSAPRKAIEFYEKSIQIHPTSFSHTRVAEIYDQYADYDKAIYHYKSALNFEDAEKIYLYNRISRAYMYMSNDKMADKYREKSEKSPDVSTNRISYHFSPEELVGPRRSKKKASSGPLKFIVFLIILFGIFSLFLSLKSNYDFFKDNPIGSVSDNLFTNSDDTFDVTDDSLTVSDETTTVSATPFIRIDPIDTNTLLTHLGNTNSNIFYGTKVAEITTGDYAGQVIEMDDKGIYLWNPEDETTTYINDETNASQLNELNGKIYYITNNDEDLTSVIHGIDFTGNEFLSIEGTDISNLLVDDYNLYYINHDSDSAQLVVYTFETQNELAYSLDDVTMISQNMDYIMYLSNESMYLIRKEALTSGHFGEDYIIPVLMDQWADYALIDNDKIFYSSASNLGLYMYDLTTNDTQSVLPDFDINSMDVNAFNDYLYIGHYDVDTDSDKTSVYDFEE